MTEPPAGGPPRPAGSKLKGVESVTTGKAISTLASGGPVPAEGRLEGTCVPEILWALGCQQHTGALVVDRRGFRKVLYLKEGRMVFAASTDPEDRLGAFLLRRGELSLADLIAASRGVTYGRRLGQILVEGGILDEPALRRAVRDQVHDIAQSVMSWREGAWRISRACLPVDETIHLEVDLAGLILDGLRRDQDWAWIRERVGTRRTVYRTRPGISPENRNLGSIENAVLDFLARPARVEAFLRSGIAPAGDLCRLLAGLSMMGMVERCTPSVEGVVGFSPGEGSLECGGAADLLLRLADRGFSGAVRLFHQETEGCLFLKGGRVGAVCLLSGPAFPVPPRGPEPAAQGLPSCCLGGMPGAGVLSAGAEGEGRRLAAAEALRAALGLVFWDQGEFLLEEGDSCPSGRTLDLSVEELIATAWEQTRSWTQVWSRLRSAETVFRLRPDYLDRLDRFELWPALWDLVAALRDPAPLRDLLGHPGRPDFETCRLLCGLEQIKVIERAPELERAGSDLFPAAGLEPLPDSYAVDLTFEPEAETAAELAPELFREDGETGPPPPWLQETPAEPEAARPAAEELAAAEEESETVFPEAAESKVTTVDLGALLENPAAAEGSSEWWSDLNRPAAEEGRLEEGSPEPEAEAGESWAKEPVDEPFAPEEPPPAVEESEGDPSASVITGPIAAGEFLSGAFPPAEEAVLPEAAGLLPPLVPEEAGPVSRNDEPPGPEEAAVSTPAEAAQPIPEPAAVPEAEPGVAEEPAPGAALETGPEDEVPPEAASGIDAAPLLPDEPEPEVSEALLAQVERFNRRHSVVFTHLRLEIGAGARNLVLACLRRLGDEAAAFEGLTPDREGQFEAAGLARNLARCRMSAEHLEALIQAEVGLVRDLVSPTRLEAIVRGLASLSY